MHILFRELEAKFLECVAKFVNIPVITLLGDLRKLLLMFLLF